MRLVRELLVADAEPAVVQSDVVGRAERYLDVLVTGLGLRGGAVLLRGRERGLEVVAGTFGAAARDLLTDADGRVGSLVRRTAEERRAFLIRRGTDDPLLACLREGDPDIGTVVLVPLVDRTTTAVLLLAGDETTLAAEVVRALTPALRLMAILIAPSRDGVILAAPSDGLLESVRAERDENARTIQQLATRVGELETALAAARELAVTAPAEPAPAAVTPSVVEAVAAANVEATGALLAAAGPPEPTLVVVIDDAADWDGLARDDQRVLVTAPADLDAAALGADPPARLVVNLAAPGGLARLAALRRDGVTAPAFGVLRDVENTRVVGLGLVEVVDPQASPEALVAAVEATAPRGARVFAAGRDADALMKMRQVLAKQGLSVSMARDTKQIEELVAMVRPQVMVVDLGLPGAEGYELVFRAAAMAPAPGVVVILSDADPLPTLSKKLRERLAAGVGTSVRDFFALASAQKLDVKRAKARPAAAHAAL